MFMFDSSFLVVIPALLLAFYAQWKVKSTFRKFNEIPNARGVTGAQAAQYILQQNGLSDVRIEEVPGQLSDHYDPRDRTVRLSSNNFRGHSIAALSVAAHEVGHAIQHKIGYAPLQWRHAILPVTSLGSSAAFPLFFIGMLFQWSSLMTLGIIFFAAALIFHLVTLPVEFNASSRAIAKLGEYGMLDRMEIGGAKKVLNAAALTYVGATAVAAMQLVQMLLIRDE
ncbi:MAG TPA: zinc metallopeptidase [Calditrichia bacterium]|nr:zinc metallopeptidase [Calditrichota bacterium]HQU74058.1 zinc metallopeptidase [Calditrichia bacterium]HQV30516.1 zinc metallopeptidase [Calditrichia bacterium]